MTCQTIKKMNRARSWGGQYEQRIEINKGFGSRSRAVYAGVN